MRVNSNKLYTALTTFLVNRLFIQCTHQQWYLMVTNILAMYN